MNTDDLLYYLEINKKHLEKPISLQQVNDLIYYLDKKWYLQLLKEFGIIFALLLIEYFKNIEEYLVCKEILETIRSSNKYFGTTYPESLEEYGKMYKLL